MSEQALVKEVAELRGEIARLTEMVEILVSPAASLSLNEKAELISKAQASGDRRQIMAVTRMINNSTATGKKRKRKSNRS